MMTKIYVFPGQGSQRVGMGADLFKLFPSETDIAASVLGYDLAELCERDPRQELNRTNFTQPALFVVNALSYLKKVQEALRKPDFVAGHSLGEYDALYASGVFDFETGLRLVQKRGALMSHATGGGMAAVIGFSRAKIEEVLAGNGLPEIDIANLNAPQQIVISGPADRIQAAGPIFEKAGCRMFIPLKVSGAFHSRYMAGARAEFEAFLKTFEFFDPQIPVISNVTAQAYEKSEVARNLADQITSPVGWSESIQFLLGKADPQFEEVGPGNVLTGLIRQIKAG